MKTAGYKSRKMVMAYVCIVLIGGGFLATGIWPSLEAAYATFIMGVLGAATIYTGGNTAEALFTLKHGSKEEGSDEPPVEPAKD